MSRTLFFYIFKDLFRIFVMTSGALAGIMSFGGLLRPLTREGLDAGQVARMLTYFGPAMTTYSFPVAALFATAVVYGRLAADNELTACKAGGISLLSLTVSGPAVVLGLIVAIVSLLFLCFVVPASTLRVEKVIYSNLAKLVQSRIERTHEIEFQTATIFAQEAHVIPPGPDTPPGVQEVELIGPEIISTERDPVDHVLMPKEFYTASSATVFIKPQNDGQQVNVTVTLKGGFKFPRRFVGATMAGVKETEFGPTEMPSPIKEDVKFMDVLRLKELYRNLGQSRKLQTLVAEFVKNGQRNSFLNDLAKDLNNAGNGGIRDFEGGYELANEGNAYAGMTGSEIVVPWHPPVKGAATRSATEPATKSTSATPRPIVFRQFRKDQSTLTIRAAQLLVRARPLPASDEMTINVELHDCLQTNESAAAGANEPVLREKFVQQFTVPMSDEGKMLGKKGIGYFESKAGIGLGDQKNLTREKTALINAIISESNGRASFAISCLILVMVGSALGMMFRSGNFLTAFAVSFIPALLSITLIIAGQRTASNVHDVSHNPLQVGLIIIWTGNAVNLILAIGLLWKLGRR